MKIGKSSEYSTWIGVLFIESNVAMERDEALIEVVREYLCLYNSRSNEYKVQSKKENAWTAITELLERSGKYYYVTPRVIFLWMDVITRQ